MYYINTYKILMERVLLLYLGQNLGEHMHPWLTAHFAPPRPQFRRHCTSQSVAAAADLKPASRELGGAIAFFRALFGCFVLNFSSHFLLLTPPGKKTTTGDTTSSLKNYVQNKSYYQCFQICLLWVFSERKVQCCL